MKAASQCVATASSSETATATATEILQRSTCENLHCCVVSDEKQQNFTSCCWNSTKTVVHNTETYGVAGSDGKASHGLASLIHVATQGSPGAVPLVPLDVADDLFACRG